MTARDIRTQASFDTEKARMQSAIFRANATLETSVGDYAAAAYRADGAAANAIDILFPGLVVQRELMDAAKARLIAKGSPMTRRCPSIRPACRGSRTATRRRMAGRSSRTRRSYGGKLTGAVAAAARCWIPLSFRLARNLSRALSDDA